MRTVRGWVLFLTLLTGVFAGCDEDIVPPNSKPSPYSLPTAPESLITNLEVAYRRREIQEYAKLLAPEFIFQFQPLDANDIGTPFWTHDQDSIGTRALFNTTEVSDIRISLLYGAPDTTIDFPGTPQDSLKIRIITTDLQVDQTDGTTWIVSDQQDFYFRLGRAVNGEDPTHWFIYKWQDLPSLSAPSTGVRATTWGKLKTRY